MPITICPNCSRKVYYADNSGPDVVHRCDSKKDAIDKDSIIKSGDWTDSDGTTGTVSNANLQGMAKTRVGGLLSHELNIESLNVKGDRESTHRLRQHEEFINLR